MEQIVVEIDGVLKSWGDVCYGSEEEIQEYRDAVVHARSSLGGSVKWLTGVCWDTSKADKPTALNLPQKIDLESEPVYTKLKGWNSFGNYYMLFETEEEAKVGFKKMCEWLYSKREAVLSKQLEEFQSKRGDFMKRQLKKVGLK